MAGEEIPSADVPCGVNTPDGADGPELAEGQFTEGRPAEGAGAEEMPVDEIEGDRDATGGA